MIDYLVLTFLDGDLIVKGTRPRNGRVDIIKVLMSLFFIMNLKRFHMMLNVNKVTDPLMGPILLHEYLKNSKLVQGWVRIPGSKLCWHVWVERVTGEGNQSETTGEGNQSEATGIIDIHALTIDSELKYVYEATEEFDSDRQVLDTWDLYQKSQKDYWKSKPMGIRSKLLASLKTC